MNDILNQLLQSDTETEVLEFKQAENQFDRNKLGKYFSALSNEANLKGKNKAWILFGVNDEKDVVGTNISEKQLNEYKREISNNTSPTSSFVNIHRVSTSNGDVLMLEIPSAQKGMPVSWKGHYYGRDGESLGALNSEEYDRIRNQVVQEDWSSKIIADATIEDLSKEAIERARVLYGEKNLELEEDIKIWDDITFLNKAKITVKGKITNTAILLLGKSESEYYISPAVAKMTWILKDRDNVSKDYEHFTCPFLLTASQLRNKIRNLKYRYIKNESLFPDEVDSYDPYIIREALNNCIAHQDYTMGGKINVVENEDSKLIFLNKGEFIPRSIKYVLESDAPEPLYRNKFLTEAMVNLKMIDTIGSGILKMFNVQRKKYFPLPDYNFENNSVKVVIEGKILDINYASKLASVPNLNLNEIILLDKVAKKKILTADEVKELKRKRLIEGRKPNFHISVSLAKATGQETEYLNMKGVGDEYYISLVTSFIKGFGVGSRKNIEDLLKPKLPAVLSNEQKEHKVKNILQKMKQLKVIKLNDKRQWIEDDEIPF